MATISDIGPASAERVNQAVRNLGKEQSAVRTTGNGFEVDDEIEAEYNRLRDEQDAEGRDRGMDSNEAAAARATEAEQVDPQR